MSSTNGGSEEKKSPEAAVKITVNPDLPLKRDGVETLAGLSPRMTKKQRSSYADHTGLWLSLLLFFARPWYFLFFLLTCSSVLVLLNNIMNP